MDTERVSLFHNTAAANPEVNDLAKLTPQCGRRGDALKMFLGWSFYGKEGYARLIEHAYDTAQHLYGMLQEHPNFVLVSKQPLPCMQVCFYWGPNGKLAEEEEMNTNVTATIAEALRPRGFMVDYAPGDHGMFFRVVVGRETRRETVEGLVKAIDELGEEVVRAGGK